MTQPVSVTEHYLSSAGEERQPRPVLHHDLRGAVLPQVLYPRLRLRLDLRPDHLLQILQQRGGQHGLSGAQTQGERQRGRGCEVTKDKLQERIENTGKRRGVSNSNDWKRKRPIGLGEYKQFKFFLI